MVEIILLVLCIVLLLAILFFALFVYKKRKNTIQEEEFEFDDNTLKILEEKIARRIAKEISDENYNFSEKVSSKFGEINQKLEKDLQANILSLNDFKDNVRSDLKKTQDDYVQNLQTLKDNMFQRITDLNNSNLKSINEFQESMLKTFNDNIKELSERVDNRLGKGFEVNSENLEKVNISLGKITEAQKNLDKLSSEVSNLNGVLTNSQKRGRFGEIALESILNEVFGETKNTYYLQTTISGTQVRPDAMIVLPEPDNLLCIDSKFSFVEYERFFNQSHGLSEEERKKTISSLRDNLKSQITKIANDYIIYGKTSQYAIMFIPNDGIYSFIQTNSILYESVVAFARSKNVVLTSPSTLQPILATLNTLRVNFEMSKNIKKVIEEINKISALNKTFSKRWDVLYKSISSLIKKSDEFNTTVDKIGKKTSNVVSIAVKNNIIDKEELTIEEQENTLETDFND